MLPSRRIFVIAGLACVVVHASDIDSVTSEACVASAKTAKAEALLQSGSTYLGSAPELNEVNLPHEAVTKESSPEDAFAAMLLGMGEAGDASEKGGGGKKSIFQLKISDVDNYLFWQIMAGMLVFTIAVDRMQAYLDFVVADSESGQMLLKRVYGEFVMFGVVAISIFVGNNCVKIESDTFSQLEFVDILCSVACCTLIVIVAVLFMANARSSKRFLEFEQEDCDETTPLSGTELGAKEYQAVAKHFRDTHKLPEHFVFSVYLKECFVRDCCDIMNVKWNTWLVLLVPALAMYALKVTYWLDVMSADVYLMRMLCAILFVFMLHAGLALYAWQTYSGFLANIPDLPNQKPALEGDEEVQAEHNWGDCVRWVLQIISIMNTFLIAHFLMNCIHVVNINEVGSIWYVMLAAPLCINVFGFLPAMTNWVSVVDAFYGANAEALDAVLTQINKVDEDMRYVRMLWKFKGEPMPSGDIQEYNLEDFTNALLKDFELHVSEARARRLFAVFDADEGGTVSVAEFLAGLRNDDENTEDPVKKKAKAKSLLRRLASATDMG